MLRNLLLQIAFVYKNLIKTKVVTCFGMKKCNGNLLFQTWMIISKRHITVCFSALSISLYSLCPLLVWDCFCHAVKLLWLCMMMCLITMTATYVWEDTGRELVPHFCCCRNCGPLTQPALPSTTLSCTLSLTLFLSFYLSLSLNAFLSLVSSRC